MHLRPLVPNGAFRMSLEDWLLVLIVTAVSGANVSCKRVLLEESTGSVADPVQFSRTQLCATRFL